MEKKIIFTVDVEPDWGWRTETTQGIDEGLPKIVELFEKYNITPIYFEAPPILNTCNVRGYRGIYGYHPKEKEIVHSERFEYIRGHKFLKFYGWKSYLPYSSSDNSTSLLMHMWNIQYLGGIFYLHPFDIVRPKTTPPNLFCKLWYSQPERAYETLKNIVAKYS